MQYNRRSSLRTREPNSWLRTLHSRWQQTTPEAWLWLPAAKCAVQPTSSSGRQGPSVLPEPGPFSDGLAQLVPEPEHSGACVAGA